MASIAPEVTRDPRAHNQTLDLLTELVDRTSLRYVLETLGEVASTKADAQADPIATKQWDFAAACLLSMSQRPHVTLVSPVRS